MSDLLLAGDLGGTKINLALFDSSGDGTLTPLREATYATAAASGLGHVALDFLAGDRARLVGAAFGVAGPVEDGHAHMVNVHFDIHAKDLAAQLGLAHVELINDLVATGYGINALPESAFATLNAGDANSTGNGALLAAGTGLGKAILTREGRGGRNWRPLPSEGGHADFAPTDDDQIELLRYLRRRHGAVDVERVLSGPGIGVIFDFLRETFREEVPAELARRLNEAKDDSRVISEAGVAGEFPICARAMGMFADIYASEAGNFALDCLATGGLWIGGGIAPKILPLLRTERFRRHFTNKARVPHIMRDIPLHVILEPKAALYGAALYAGLCR